jgi:predicted nucleic acid-binding Zn ribbon protein
MVAGATELMSMMNSEKMEMGNGTARRQIELQMERAFKAFIYGWLLIGALILVAMFLAWQQPTP